ncbi:MAG: type VI secretion system contractile sheath large subunit [Gammaproteobacteria bacterium]|nr:type VI secretion system contractile sheath large subunit [Gammaproteobacteria bacterium]
MSEQSSAVKEGELIGQLMQHTNLGVEDEGYAATRAGVELLLTELIENNRIDERADKRFVDQMIHELDRRLSQQMDEILHHPTFQELESTWKSLEYLLQGTDFRENIKVQVISTSKTDLFEDFEDAPDFTKSGLYRHLYTEEFGQFGGLPVGAVITDYSVSHGSQDVKLMQHLATLGGMIHAPIILNADASFFGVTSYSSLPQLKELGSIFDSPNYAKWNGFRDSDLSRNIGLTMPKMMIRQPYGEDNPAKSFNYEETTGTTLNNYLWGNASFAFGANVNDSFAQYRWCPNIIGPTSGGGVNDMDINVVEQDGQELVIGPVETTISDRREYELAEMGFIPLVLKKGSNQAAFFSANSTQRPQFFGNDEEGRQAELNFRLGTQLPYMFIVNRLAHYIKVLQRENLGSWKSRGELEGELNKWLRQYVADQENPSPATRAQRPLRKAELTVSTVPGEVGWYSVQLEVTPHFKYMGASFTLNLTSTLDAA